MHESACGRELLLTDLSCRRQNVRLWLLLLLRRILRLLLIAIDAAAASACSLDGERQNAAVKAGREGHAGSLAMLEDVLLGGRLHETNPVTPINVEMYPGRKFALKAPFSFRVSYWLHEGTRFVVM